MVYLFIFLIMALGGALQGMCGFGAALVCMPILVGLMDYKAAVPVMYVASLVTNARILIKTHRSVNWKLLIIPVAFSFLGRILGMIALNQWKSEALGILLGGLIMAIALFQLTCKGRIRIMPGPRNGAIAGLASGIFGGISSAGGPPMVLYYMNLELDKYEYISTLQMTFLAGTLFSIGMTAARGGYTADILKYAAAAAAGILSGALAGLRLFERINREALTRIINGMLLLMGAALIINTVL